MIWESHFWKDDLLKKAKSLQQCRRRCNWSETQLGRLEQGVMLGFYSIRKLADAGKLSAATMTQELSLAAYKWLGKPVTKLNWHHIDRLYDLENAATESRSLLKLCHQFVHSFIFIPDFDGDDKLSGFMFASDHQRQTALLRIGITDVVAVFKQVGKDYPATAFRTFNQKKGDYEPCPIEREPERET